MSSNIVVIGMGYVGLPLAIAAAKVGHSVVGVDVNREKIASLNEGISTIEDVNDSELIRLISSKSLKFSSDYRHIEKANVVLVCVPTPLLSNKSPDLSFLESATQLMREYLTKDTLVILESTVAPGTTRNLFVELIKSNVRLNTGDIKVAYSPERIDPINKNWSLKNTPKIVAGLTNESLQAAMQFYSTFIDKVIKCETLEVAETAKLLENSFRLINISFINELSKLCNELSIDIQQVIKAASTKPYGFMPFYPSVGIGGHCIPVDPIYLANKAREIGVSTSLIDLAVQINQEMPGYFVGRAQEKLGKLKNKKILVVGVSYKPNVADVRESPAEALIFGLKQKGALVSWHDDLVKEWNGEKSVPLSNDFDLAIIATPHEYINFTLLGSVPILNTRGSI